MRLAVAFVCVVMLLGAPRGEVSAQSSRAPARAALNRIAVLEEQIASLYGDGRLQEASALLEQVVTLRSAALGPTHPSVAATWNTLGILYKAQQEYAKAERAYLRAVAILEKSSAPRYPDAAAVMRNLARLHFAQGAYAKAASLLARVLDLQEAALGPMHVEVATSLSELASAHSSMAAFAKAEPYARRAVEIFEKTLGPEHLYVAQGLNNLGWLYESQGAFARAEPLYVRALQIAEKARGPRDPEVATILNNLALLYASLGRPGEAEPLLVRALSIREESLGPAHALVAGTLSNLATVHLDRGSYRDAEPLLLRALELSEQALGATHPDVAKILNNLAMLYDFQGAFGKSTPLYRRALAINERALGPDHPEVAKVLCNLGWLARAQGDLEEARKLYAQSLAIRERVQGPTHPDIAVSLNNLAKVREVQGARREAEDLYVRALAMREKSLGPMHPDVAQSLRNLAEVRIARGGASEAYPLLERAAELRELQLRTELPRLSERRKRALLLLLQGETESTVSLQAKEPASARALELAFTAVLRNKGRTLDSMVDHLGGLRGRLTPGSRKVLELLVQARAELTNQLYGPKVSPSDGGASISSTRRDIEQLEATLAASSVEFRVREAPVTLAAVQRALAPGSALVELIHYHRYQEGDAQPWKEARYFAYVLTSRGPPRGVALGEAAAIDRAVEAVLSAMRPRSDAKATQAALRHLHSLVMTPLADSLKGVAHLIVAPDGELSRVPFEALVDGQGHSLLEICLVSYVTTGRDLLRLQLGQRSRSSGVLMAAPEYGATTSPPRSGTASFPPLSGALQEATELRQYFARAPLLGEQATKAALAGLHGPAILHLATHGFYRARPGGGAPAADAAAAADATRRELERGMYVQGGGAALPSSLWDSTYDLSNALDLSGLALAGANRGAEGIVTARELSGFDLWGTQIVVLSACQTGAGALASGDGVYGLRRALVLAGAESQVVALWDVSDSAGQALMRDYYAALARGMGRAEALRQAKLKMMKEPTTANPFYWAVFVSFGDWRALTKGALAGGRP